MNSWILLFVINAVVIEVLGIDEEKAVTECIEETNVDLIELIDDRKGKPNNNPAVKCYSACMAKKWGWMSDDGKIIRNKLLAKPVSDYPEEIRPAIEDLLRKCLKTYKNHCETAYFVMKCLRPYRAPNQ